LFNPLFINKGLNKEPLEKNIFFSFSKPGFDSKYILIELTRIYRRYLQSIADKSDIDVMDRNT